MILQSIREFTRAERLVEALVVTGQRNCSLWQFEAIRVPLKRQLVGLKALEERIVLARFIKMDL